MTRQPPRYIFTLTGGRTGTAWLADLLGRNLGFAAVHEPLGIDDFGARMPTIRIMRTFNERGSDAHVRGFWQAKLAQIGKLDGYVETNHTLGKCGLIENLAASPIADRAAVLVVRRDKVGQCLSHIVRGDFQNITINWQWYLDPAYRNVIVDPGPFLRYGQLGEAMWYLHEMEARQRYYLETYGGRLRFIELDLAEVTTPAGAQALLTSLGRPGQVLLPPARNQSKLSAPPDVADAVRAMLTRINWDPAALVRGYLASGARLDRSEAPEARTAKAPKSTGRTRSAR